MSDRLARYKELATPFQKLQQKIDEDLAATGFSPQAEPPLEEPELPSRLSGKTSTELKNLYDDLLRFYGYLSDQTTRYEPFLVTTKKVLETLSAEARKEANSNSSLKNAEARKAYIETHSAVLSATADYLYFKQLNAAQEERKRKLSKYMDRVYRELALRQNHGGGGYRSKYGSSHQDPPSYSQPKKTPVRALFIQPED